MLQVVHASVDRAVMRLGIGELQLLKKGLLTEMQQSLGEVSHFTIEVILIWPLSTLVKDQKS